MKKPRPMLKKPETCGPMGCGRVLGFRQGTVFVTHDGLEIHARESFDIKCICRRMTRFYRPKTKKQRTVFD